MNLSNPMSGNSFTSAVKIVDSSQLDNLVDWEDETAHKTHSQQKKQPINESQCDETNAVRRLGI